MLTVNAFLFSLFCVAVIVHCVMQTAESIIRIRDRFRAMQYLKNNSYSSGGYGSSFYKEKV
jgi:hypothetical protein